MSGLTPQRVLAVVVSYQACPPELEALLKTLEEQVEAVVLVDNGSPTWEELQSSLPLHVVRLGQNIGLAGAQNVGLEHARQMGATHMLLLDQDSLPQPGMVAELLAVGSEASRAGMRVGAVGPFVLHASGKDEGFVRFGNGRYQAFMPAPGESWIRCDMLIASGTLIEAQALAEIGLMNSAFFIDKVDTDWCLRATAAGYCLLGAARAHLRHRLGDRTFCVWFGRRRELAWHAPFRYYYMVRNGLLLRRLPHASPAWRVADLRQLASLVLYFGLLAPNRGQALRMMVRGFWDGLRGRAGAL